MTIIVDTNVLLATVNREDPRHAQANQLMKRILAGEWGAAMTTDYVLDEGLTFLRMKTGRVAACRDYASFMIGEGRHPPPLILRETSRRDVERAMTLFFRHFERGLSFTDASLAALADELAGAVASFDAGFDGIVARVA